MSITNFTPGPWHIFDTHPEKACFYIDRADTIGEHAVGEVAVIYTTTNETKRANARLIAAAPDLLASLTDAAIRCAGLHGGKFREHRCVTCTKWLDVIAKAVGP